MGKSKRRNRAKDHRANPTAKAIKPPTDPELAELRQKRILPVLQDLQSPDLNTRLAAARAITNLIDDIKTRKLLLREQIVKILLEQTLTDLSVETRADGWGILRNLVIEEDRDFCVYLYRQDILTAIDGAGESIKMAINSTDAPFMKWPKSKQEVVWTLTSSIISLISSLSEAQDEINQAITNRVAISQFLVDLVANNATPNYILCEVFSCLSVLLEDNATLATKLMEREDWFLQHLATMSGYSDMIGITACGVLHNIFSSMQWYQSNTASDPDLICSLALAMDPDKPQKLSSPDGIKNSTPEKVVQLALEITASIASSVQDALEHASKHGRAKDVEEFKGFDDTGLTNGGAEPMETIEDIEAEVDAEGEDMDAEAQGGDSDEMDEDEMDADMEMVTADGMEIYEADMGESTLHRLVERTVTPIINLTLRALQNNKPLVPATLAASALSNIAWVISNIDFSDDHPENTFEQWAPRAQYIMSEIVSIALLEEGPHYPPTDDMELASVITGLAWAAARSLRGIIKIQLGVAQKFFDLYQVSRTLTAEQETRTTVVIDGGDDAFQSLGVKCIGLLGTLALVPATLRLEGTTIEQAPAQIELNREIGTFLITVLSDLPGTPPADAIEALNQIFDIYADKSSAFDEPVFWGDNFFKHLEDLQHKVKRMAKDIDKRLFTELRERADEAVLNLHRFLSYKRKEKKEAQNEG